MKTQKPNLIKLIKAAIFIVIGILFLFVVFYDIQKIIEYNGIFWGINNPMVWNYGDVFDLFFKQTIFNYIFSSLFILLGILELKEAFSNGDQ